MLNRQVFKIKISCKKIGNYVVLDLKLRIKRGIGESCTNNELYNGLYLLVIFLFF